MNTVTSLDFGDGFAMRELDEQDIENVSGGFPPAVAAAAVVALGGAALDLGHKLGGMLYRALH